MGGDPAISRSRKSISSHFPSNCVHHSCSNRFTSLKVDGEVDVFASPSTLHSEFIALLPHTPSQEIKRVCAKRIQCAGTA